MHAKCIDMKKSEFIFADMQGIYSDDKINQVYVYQKYYDIFVIFRRTVQY